MSLDYARKLLAALDIWAAGVLGLEGIEFPSEFHMDGYEAKQLLSGKAGILEDGLFDADWECKCPVCSADPSECKRAYLEVQKGVAKEVYERDKRDFEARLNRAIEFSNLNN